MKQNFVDTNIEPYPNPKPLTVQRVSVRLARTDEHGNTTYSNEGYGFITNAALDPHAHTTYGLRWLFFVPSNSAACTKANSTMPLRIMAKESMCLRWLPKSKRDFRIFRGRSNQQFD